MSKSITYNGVAFLHQEETYEVRKNQTGTIQYYTHADTGESGMSLRGLANACGIALSALQKLPDNPTFFEEVTTKTAINEVMLLDKKGKEVTTKLDIYLIQTDDLHVIRDIFCERVIYYYAFESRYKKTKARELYQALAQNGLRSFIHSKTGYQATLAAQHDASLTLSIEEQLQREVEELKLKLVKREEQLAERDTEIHNLKYRPVNERTYQAYLQGVMGGSRELYLSGPYPGRVDLVTEQMVVEVKRAINFEHAFGQLLRYRAKLQDSEHAGKTYMIYLFGTVSSDERRVLDAMAHMANFQLMIECELQDYMDANEMTTRDKIRVVVNNDS